MQAIVSIFKNVKEVHDPVYMELDEYLAKTRDGGKDSWEDIVTECRLITEENERNEFKRTMPTTCLSGEFSTRRDDGLLKHNGFIAIDLDHVEHINIVKAKLKEDKHVYSVFLSTSGLGLRVLFLVEEKKHREAFLGISQYLWEVYGVTADPNGISISKPFVVSFDPDLYICFTDVPIFKKYVKETVIKPIANFVFVATDFDIVFKQVIGRNINLCEEYQDWLKIGFALAEQFGEDGRSYFHELSKMSAKYNQKTTDIQYKACLRAKGQSKANISTFYYLAKLNGIKINTRQTQLIVRYGVNGRKAGLSREAVAKNLKKYENIEGAEQIIEQLYENEDDNYSEEESILHQLELYIQNSYNLKMNEVTGYLEENGVALSPSEMNSIFISAKKMIPKLDYQLMIRLLKSNFIESYNPFYKFWESDGIPVILPATPEAEKKHESPLIDLLSKTIINDDPAYTLYFLRKWIVGTVSAAHKVHCPIMFELLGAQGTGKTEWFRRLPPKELLQYYAESKLDKEKDDELLMTENLWCIDDELGGKTRSDNLKIKNISSKQWFSLRRPYGDHNEKILRLSVLGGSSNLLDVLQDSTGNRRVVPVYVTDIDKELLNSIDKTELWKEAYRLYKEGFDWRINHRDISYLNQDKEKYEMVVKERELLCKYFEDGDERVTTSEILVELEILTKQKLSLNTLGRELNRMEFQRKTTRDKKDGDVMIDNSKTIKKWCVKRINRNNDMTFKNTDEEGFNTIEGAGF